MDKFKEGIEFSKKQLMPGAFTYFGTGFASSDKHFAAGVDAAREAISYLQDKDYSMAIAFVTPNYDYNKVYEAISSVLGDIPLLMIINDYVGTNRIGSSDGVAVGVFSDKIKTHVEIAKGFSLTSRKAIHTAVEKLLERPSQKEFNYLLFFAPNSIPLAGENTFNALQRFAPEFHGIIGGVIGTPRTIEYQTFIFNGKTYTDHAFFIKLESDIRFHIDQAHGFHPVRPFKVTKVRGDMIVALDDEPAFYALLDVLSRKGFNEEDIKDPMKVTRILHTFQFAVADKNKPGIFRAVIPMNISEKGIMVSAFLNEGDSIWLMESSEEEMIEGVEKMMGRAMGKLDKINGAIIFESYIRRKLLSAENYRKEQETINENLKAPYLLVETIEEIVISSDVYSGAHMGSVAAIFF